MKPLTLPARARAPLAAFAAFAAFTAFTALSALPARAHIEYYDLNQGRQIADLTAAGKAIAGNDIPLGNPAYWNATYQSTTSSGETWTSLGGSYASGTWGYSVRVVTMDTSSWTDGLRNNPQGGLFLLGDTHKLGFANFRLEQNARVGITLADDLAGSGYGLNPSFSLYRGAAVYQAHDDSAADPLHPKAGVPPAPVQSAQDNGAAVDSQGIVSPYRNTFDNSGTYFGQFDALGGFSVGNPAGNWSAVRFITAVTGAVNPDGSWLGNANSNALVDYLLPAGDYIIAFGGNAQPASYDTARSGDTTSLYGTVSNQVATLTFSAAAVAPVPEPSAWMVLLAGTVLAAGLARRRFTDLR